MVGKLSDKYQRPMMMRFASSIPATRLLILFGLILSTSTFAHIVGRLSDEEPRLSVDAVHNHETNDLKSNGITSNIDAHVGHDHDSLYANCPTGEVNPEIEAIEAVNGSCLPTPTRELLNWRRDLAICQCLDRNRATAQGLAYATMVELDPEANRDILTRRAMNSNVARLNRALAAEQSAMQFHASTLPANDNTNKFLIGAFTNRLSFDLNTRVSEVQIRAQQGFNSVATSSTVGMTPITVPPVPSGDLLAPLPSEDEFQCLPLRTFMTSKQIPSDPLFFQDLATLPAIYPPERWHEWDYHRLKINFIRMSRTVSTLSAALENPEAKKLYLRIQFLERNPLYRNLFSSNSPNAPEKKQELWNMIRTAYGQGTRPDADSRFNAFKQLRRDTGAFFTSDDVIAMTQNGAEANFEALLNDVPQRVSSISAPLDEATLWMNASIRRGTGLRINGILRAADSIDTNRSSVAVYSDYCPRLQFNASQNQYTVLRELEESFGNAYSSNPRENTEYRALSNNLCNDSRSKPDGTRTRWPQYLYDKCLKNNVVTGSCDPRERTNLLAQYLNEYTEGNPPIDSLNNLMPFLQGQIDIPAPDRAAAQLAIQRGASSGFVNSSDYRQGIQSANADFRESGGRRFSSSPVVSSSELTSRSTTLAPSTTQNGQNGNQQQQLGNQSLIPGGPVALPDSVIIPQGVQAQARLKEASSESARAENSRNESELQSLRDQIAALRAELQGEDSKPPAQRDDQQIIDMNRRLDQLNAQLAQVTAESNRLRRGTPDAEGEDEVAVRKPRRGQTRSQSNTPELDSEAEEDAEVIPATRAQVSGDKRSSAVSSSGSAGPVSSGASLGRVGAGARATSRSINSALLGSRAGNNSGVGAITISNASSQEYQVMRQQSLGNEISESVSVEEYERIAGADSSFFTERFSEQFPTKIGEVKRFEILKQGSDGLKVEILVTRTENGISLTFGQDGSPGSDGPAIVAPVERMDTLEQLNQRIQESR